MIEHYRNLLSDSERIGYFRKAIQQLVRPESVVVEIGAALGTYSFFAAMAGARKVYAIEMTDIFYVGRELARRNHLAERISFIHGKSTDIAIPEKADLIIMEDYNPFFLYAGLKQVLDDARERFLKDGGTFVPYYFSLKLAPCEFPEMYRHIDLFRKTRDRLYDLDWIYTTELAFNQPYYAEKKPKQLLTGELTVAEFNLNAQSSFGFQFSTKIKMERTGTMHGLLGWWDAYFTPQLYYSNSPLRPSSGWGQQFFPVRHPIKVHSGEEIEITLNVIESVKQRGLDYQWIIKSERVVEEANTFRGSYLDLERLKAATPEQKIRLNRQGEIVQYLLELCQQPMTWQALAEKLYQKYPEHFSSLDQALRQVPTLLKEFIDW